jgi:hypothetical protein
MPRSASWRVPLLAFGLLVGSGCGSAHGLEEQLDTLASWTATLQLAKERHGAGAITSTYATQLADAGREALARSSGSIEREARSRVDSSYAAAALDSLRGAIRQLDAELGQ